MRNPTCLPSCLSSLLSPPGPLSLKTFFPNPWPRWGWVIAYVPPSLSFNLCYDHHPFNSSRKKRHRRWAWLPTVTLSGQAAHYTSIAAFTASETTQQKKNLTSGYREMSWLHKWIIFEASVSLGLLHKTQLGSWLLTTATTRCYICAGSIGLTALTFSTANSSPCLAGCGSVSTMCTAALDVQQCWPQLPQALGFPQAACAELVAHRKPAAWGFSAKSPTAHCSYMVTRWCRVPVSHAGD